jgi:hypothetical protein
MVRARVRWCTTAGLHKCVAHRLSACVPQLTGSNAIKVILLGDSAVGKSK